MMRQIWDHLCGLIREAGPSCGLVTPRGAGVLTASRAREIVEGFRSQIVLQGVLEISPEAAGVLALHENDLVLPSLREVSPAVARQLANHKHKLFLDGCGSLSPAVAKALAVHGLETIRKSAEESLAAQAQWAAAESIYDPEESDGEPDFFEQALREALYIHPQTLSLAGLRDLPTPVARALSGHKGALILDGVRELSDASAEALGSHFGSLYLNRLRSLSPHAARALAVGGGPWPDCLMMHIELQLRGLRSLEPAAALELAAYQGTILLTGLQDLTPDLAAALAEFRPRCSLDRLHLSGARNLSPEAARNLGPFSATLVLSGLTSVSVELAKELVEIKGRLFLPDVQRLSPAVAEILMSRLDVYLI